MRRPSIGARTSEFFICASSFLSASSERVEIAILLDPLRFHSASQSVRFALGLLEFRLPARFPTRPLSGAACRLSSAALSNSDEGRGVRRAMRLHQVCAGLFWCAGRSSRRRLLPATALSPHSFRSRRAPAEGFRQSDETGICARTRSDKGRFDPNRPIDRGDGSAPTDRNHFRYRH